MYENFTDAARKVMQLANMEAQRLNHEYLGAEHILLGLAKQGGGIAAQVLRNLDIDLLRKIHLEVEKLVQAGPEMVTMGKLPQTPRAKKVIEYSKEEARNLSHDHVGTEHILIGLLRETDGIACQVLMNLGLRIEEVRAAILDELDKADAAWRESVPRDPASIAELDQADLVRLAETLCEELFTLSMTLEHCANRTRDAIPEETPGLEALLAGTVHAEVSAGRASEALRKALEAFRDAAETARHQSDSAQP